MNYNLVLHLEIQERQFHFETAAFVNDQAIRFYEILISLSSLVPSFLEFKILLKKPVSPL